jgi:hypothetical protein
MNFIEQLLSGITGGAGGSAMPVDMPNAISPSILPGFLNQQKAPQQQLPMPGSTPQASPTKAPGILGGFNSGTAMKLLGMGLLAASDDPMNGLMKGMMLSNMMGQRKEQTPGALPGYLNKDPSKQAAGGTPTISGVSMDGFYPDFRTKIDKVLADMTARGYQPTVASGMRTQAEQDEKVRQGYSKTRNSHHLHGRAADIVDKRWGWNGPKDELEKYWQALGEAAAAQGLTWGGNWKNFRDPAHLQY